MLQLYVKISFGRFILLQCHFLSFHFWIIGGLKIHTQKTCIVDSYSWNYLDFFSAFCNYTTVKFWKCLLGVQLSSRMLIFVRCQSTNRASPNQQNLHLNPITVLQFCKHANEPPSSFENFMYPLIYWVSMCRKDIVTRTSKYSNIFYISLLTDVNIVYPSVVL